MSLRIGTIEDLPLFRKFAASFVKYLPEQRPVDQDKIERIMEDFLTDKESKIVLFYEDKGFIAGFATEYLLGTARQAADLGWWVEPEFRSEGIGKQLLEAFEYWAKNVQNCTVVQMVSLTPEVAEFYKENGYVETERAHIKEL